MATRLTTTKLAIELDGKLAASVSSLQLPGYRVQQVGVPTGSNASARLGVKVDITPLAAAFTLSQPDALTDWALSLPRGDAALVLDANNQLRRQANPEPHRRVARHRTQDRADDRAAQRLRFAVGKLDMVF